MSLTPEQISQIAVAAALEAVRVAMGAGTAPAPEARDQDEDNGEDDAAENAEAKRVIEDNESQIRSHEQAVTDLLPAMMGVRHMEIWNWAIEGSGITNAEFLRRIVRAEVARLAPLHREAIGKGGSSTKSPETMNRIRGE